MSLPIVAIMGRPNVGKSALLNMLARQRISIVDPTPGVTRDRVSAIVDVDDRYFELIDTGGYGIEDHDNLTEHVESQLRFAMAGADLILFVVDVQQEMTALDRQAADLLRSIGSIAADRRAQQAAKDRRGRHTAASDEPDEDSHAAPGPSAARRRTPVIVVANKSDAGVHETQAGAFAALGFGEPVCVSALHARGRRELLERILEVIGDSAGAEAPKPIMRVALVGRRNVGKSTFINALAGQERVIVSEVPGTTRDAVDVRFEMGGNIFLAIDTAGVRKARKQKTPIESYGYQRALASIKRADVVLFLVDASEPVGEVDKKLAHLLVEEYKPVVIVVNKWDLAKGRAGAESYGEYLTKALPGLGYAPIAFTTASEGRNIQSTIDLAMNLFKQAQTRVTTGQLNRAIEESVAGLQPASDRHGAQPKIYYATQIGVCPPTIVLFVNNPALMREQYKKYMAKRIRALLPFEEIPVRLLWRPKTQREPRGGAPGRPVGDAGVR